MPRLAVPLPLAALAALAACSSPPPQTSPRQPEIVTQVHPYRPGTGVVQAVMPTPSMAASGGSTEPMQRLEVKMDDGRIQYVDTPSRDFTRGTRVMLSENRQITRQ